MADVGDLGLRVPSPMVELEDDLLARRGVRVYLKRDDLIHPEFPGNKWRKLKYNIEAARKSGAKTLLTFGGAYSNHIRATAAAGHYFGFDTIGIIRGEEHLPLNESLAYATRNGMRVSYLDRATYRDKVSSRVLASLREEFGDFYLIPEGGSNSHALAGCREVVDEIDVEFDVICCPCGTGGTLAGISSTLSGQRRALGFSVLKGGQFLADDMRKMQIEAFGAASENWSIDYDFHMGGFARRKPELVSFMDNFEARHGLKLEWVYVAKMMYGIFSLVESAAFAPGSVLVAVVTG